MIRKEINTPGVSLRDLGGVALGGAITGSLTFTNTQSCKPVSHYHSHITLSQPHMNSYEFLLLIPKYFYWQISLI